MRIAVLYGGTSSERPVSIKTGESIIKHIDNKKYDIFPMDFDGDFKNLIYQIRENDINLVFNALHGGDGENGILQSKFEKNNIKFTGSISTSSKNAMDKNRTKQICLENNIPTAPWGIVNKQNDNYFDILKKIKGDKNSFSIVLKPINEGSSFDLFIIDTPLNSIGRVSDEFKNCHMVLLNKYGSYMIELFIKGRELTVGIVGNQILPIVEILPKNNFYDYESKYSVGMSDYVIPATLGEEVLAEINYLVMKLYKKLDCRHYGRVDIRIDTNNSINILELNTLPGMTNTSLLPKAAMSYGINYSELVEKIIKLASSYE